MRLKFFIIIISITLTFFITNDAQAVLYSNISGKVIETDTGAGLQGINIVLMSQTNGKVMETKSNANGIFVLKRVPAGIYDIIAISEDEFIMSSKTVIPVTVITGKNVVGVTIKLQRGCSIKGRVVTDTGITIPEASVVTAGSSTTTDVNGYFLLRGVPPETVNIGIVPAAIGIKTVVVTCEAGRNTEIGNVIFNIGIEYAIQGSVRDTSGIPIQGAVIVVKGNNASGGYTISAESGSFILTGLSSGIYDLYAVAYGYEPQKLTGVSSPSTGVNIVFTPSQTTTSNSVKYQFADTENKNEGLFSKILELIKTEEAFASACNNCPEGNWLGVSLDLDGLPVLRAIGASFSVGSFFCTSSRSNLQFIMICKYVGESGTTISNLGAGFSGMYCRNACCNTDLLGASTGIYFSSNKLLQGVAGGAIDFAGNTRCYTLSFQWSFKNFGFWNILKEMKDLKNFGGFVAYRTCDVKELTNIFEWLCSRGFCL